MRRICALFGHDEDHDDGAETKGDISFEKGGAIDMPGGNQGIQNGEDSNRAEDLQVKSVI